MPGYEPPKDDPTEGHHAKLHRAEMERAMRVVRTESKLISDGVIDARHLPKAERYEWPSGEQDEELADWARFNPLRFSDVWNSHRRLRMPSGVIASAKRDRIIDKLTAKSDHHPITGRSWEAPSLSHSDAFYTLWDGVVAIDERVAAAGGFASKTERSPDLPEGVALPLRDADYDKNKLRTFAHITGDQHAFMMIDQDFEEPFDYPVALRALFNQRVNEEGAEVTMPTPLRIAQVDICRAPAI